MSQAPPRDTEIGGFSRRARDGAGYLVIALLILLIAATILASRIVVTIRSGEAGVLFRRFTGTETTHIYGEGLHLIFPWDIMYVYNIRLQTEERDFTVLTSSGLPIDLKVAIRYQADIRLLTQLHVNVGPRYLQKIVLPEVEAVLRHFAGQYSPEEIYTTKRGLLDAISVNSITATEQRFVNIDDVLIKTVILPQPVAEAIEKKQVYEQQEKQFVYRLAIERQEAERKRIEATGIRDFQRTIKETLDEQQLRWQGIQATRELATSANAKTVVIGSGAGGLPIILNPGQ
jgi:regulator of protease activity HflC (stomatin/prohibitin superfamily)